jgi:hypothetical protein
MTALIRIPRRFYDDHRDRELDTPVAVKATKRHVWIDLNDGHVPELISDAAYYADENGPDVEDKWSRNLKVSAQKTVECIAAHATWEKERVPSDEYLNGWKTILRVTIKETDGEAQ